MKNPETLDEARTIHDTYNSLKEETKPARIRAVQAASPQGDNFVTESRLKEFGKELKDGVNSQFKELKEIIQGKVGLAQHDKSPRSRSSSPRPRKRVSFSDVECYNCHKMGHFANRCPQKDADGSEAGSDTEAPSASEN